MYQKGRPVLKFLWKNLSDGTLKPRKIRSEVFLNSKSKKWVCAHDYFILVSKFFQSWHFLHFQKEILNDRDWTTYSSVKTIQKHGAYLAAMSGPDLLHASPLLTMTAWDQSPYSATLGQNYLGYHKITFS